MTYCAGFSHFKLNNFLESGSILGIYKHRERWNAFNEILMGGNLLDIATCQRSFNRWWQNTHHFERKLSLVNLWWILGSFFVNLAGMRRLIYFECYFSKYLMRMGLNPGATVKTFNWNQTTLKCSEVFALVENENVICEEILSLLCCRLPCWRKKIFIFIL